MLDLKTIELKGIQQVLIYPEQFSNSSIGYFVVNPRDDKENFHATVYIYKASNYAISGVLTYTKAFYGSTTQVGVIEWWPILNAIEYTVIFSSQYYNGSVKTKSTSFEKWFARKPGSYVVAYQIHYRTNNGMYHSSKEWNYIVIQAN